MPEPAQTFYLKLHGFHSTWTFCPRLFVGARVTSKRFLIALFRLTLYTMLYGVQVMKHDLIWGLSNACALASAAFSLHCGGVKWSRAPTSYVNVTFTYRHDVVMSGKLRIPVVSSAMFTYGGSLHEHSTHTAIKGAPEANAIAIPRSAHFRLVM